MKVRVNEKFFPVVFQRGQFLKISIKIFDVLHKTKVNRKTDPKRFVSNL